MNIQLPKNVSVQIQALGLKDQNDLVDLVCRGIAAQAWDSRLVATALLAETGSWVEHRLVGRARPHVHKDGRVGRGCSIPRRLYADVVLLALHSNGGRADIEAVYEVVESSLGPWFIDSIERAPMPSSPGDLRWKNHTRQAKREIANVGLVYVEAKRGDWILTPEGDDTARSLVQECGVRIGLRVKLPT